MTLPFAGCTALVVDDEESVRHLMRHSLALIGFGVVESKDGQSALAAVRQRGDNLDLLIVDLCLPDISGAQLAEKVLSVRSSLRVLYVTGFSHAEAIERGCPADAMLITKPFNITEFLAKVRQTMAVDIVK